MNVLVTDAGFAPLDQPDDPAKVLTLAPDTDPDALAPARQRDNPDLRDLPRCGRWTRLYAGAQLAAQGVYRAAAGLRADHARSIRDGPPLWL